MLSGIHDLSFNFDVKDSISAPINLLPNTEFTFFLQHKINLEVILGFYDTYSGNQAWFEYWVDVWLWLIVNKIVFFSLKTFF